MKRRKFLITTTSCLGFLGYQYLPACISRNQSIKIGLISDLHYADRTPPVDSNRYYNESLDKLTECVNIMNERKVDFLIELGDFKDQDEIPDERTTLEYLDTIEDVFSRFNGPRYHVLGNHDHDSISKQQFLDRISNRGFSKASNYYSFDFKDFHFIVLDANYSSKGYAYDHGNFDWKDAFIPEDQFEWLKGDLYNNQNPTIVFIHHRLDCNDMNGEYCPKNAGKIREAFEKDGKVMLVIQGHYHQGDFSRVNNIFYYTLKAAVEGSGMSNNNYAILEINTDLEMMITGYRNTESLKISGNY